MSKAQARSLATREVYSLACYQRRCERQLNAVELFGLINAFAKVFRKACEFAADYAVAIATYITRHAVDAAMPDERAAIGGRIDVGLVATYPMLRRGGLTLHTAIAIHIQAVQFVMPAQALGRVVARAGDNYEECSSAAHELISSLTCGRVIYGYAVAILSAKPFLTQHRWRDR